MILELAMSLCKRNVTPISRARASDYLRNETSGLIFSVFFKKRTDGKMREMTCRVGVKAQLRGGKLPYPPKAHNLLPVFDLQVRDYRMVNLTDLVSFNIHGETFIVKP
jgi:hypothetical protein